MKNTATPRLAWALTGSGHYIRECLALLEGRTDLDLFLSRAAAEVLAMYDIDQTALCKRFPCYRDNTASAPVIARLYAGWYSRLVVAPATSNTVAKMVCGISDTLVTNLYAQAGKCRIPSIVFACDTAPALETAAPGGQVMVYPRPIDLDNVERLRGFAYTRVVDTFDALTLALAADGSA